MSKWQRNCSNSPRLDIQAEDVGGAQGRKLIFNTGTGNIWIKKLNKSALSNQDSNTLKGNKF